MKARLAILACVIAGAPAPAIAHAFLETAAPRAGETLRFANKVELHFSEALEPVFSGIAVTNEAGEDENAGPAAVDGSTMRVPLKKLVPGRYRVTWHAVSVDTHRTAGKYDFLVLP